MSASTRLTAKLRARVGDLVLDAEIDTGAGTLVVVGPNGAGKSTLLSVLLGARGAEEGRIAVGDAVLLDTERGIDLRLEHRRLGYVPQDYGLFPHMTVHENVAFALGSAPEPLAPEAREARVRELLTTLGLEGYDRRRTPTLSGGEKQRVALARALSVGPRALLLDEPLAALDVHSRRKVRTFLARYLGELTLPTIVVTHDAADAQRLGHRIAVLERGRVTQVGTWAELASAPASPFVEDFIASANADAA